jgi:hypothetical protein
LQNSKKGVTPAKAGVQKLLKRLDSRFRGNDNLGLLQLPYNIDIEYLWKNGKRPHENMGKKYPLVRSTCKLNIHLPVSDPFCLGPRRRATARE